jgi:hypothetical protein
MFHDRAIWRTILAMLNANPKVARGGFGEYWPGSCYTDSLLIGIRRETGGDRGSIGLLRSLKALTSNPRMATRAWYVQQVRLRDHQGWDVRALAELDPGFDRYAGPGRPFIDPALVQQDISALEAVITHLNTYTSKAIAHRDDDVQRRVRVAPPVTWAELDAALDAVGCLGTSGSVRRNLGALLLDLVLVCRASRSVGSATAGDRTEMRRTEQGARIEYERLVTTLAQVEGGRRYGILRFDWTAH